MTALFTQSQWLTTPTGYWTIQYEYKRNGADMQYRFYWKVWLKNSTNYFYNGLQLQLFLNGVQYNVTVKGYNTNEKGWSYDGTTGWYTVSSKTSGTVPFYAKLYDTGYGTTKATSSTYSLTVSGAASVLGTISNFVIGNGITIPITKYDSSFTDTLVVTYGGTTVYTLSGAQQGTVVWFSSAQLSTIYSLMSTVKSGTFTFTLTTKNGSTTLGSSTKTATGSIESANPTFSADKVTYADTNTTVVGITGNNQHIVQNKSSLTVYLESSTGNKGATISKYDVTVNGVKKSVTSKGSIAFGAVNTSKNTNITVVVTDSRGNTTTVNKTITILPYAAPSFSVVLTRLNNYEDETYLTVDASISSVNSKNTLTLSYKKKQSGGSYGSEVALSNRTKHTTSCNKNYSFVFSITAKDKFSTVTKEFVLPKGRFPLFIDTEKNAVGINEFPGTGEALRVSGGVACFDDGIVLKSGSKAFKITIGDDGVLVIEEIL